MGTLPVALVVLLGVLEPAAPFTTTPVVVGGFDVFLSPRLSLRPTVLWSSPSVENVTLRRVALQWEMLYHWPLTTRWRVFGGGGAGMHLFQRKVNGLAVGEDDELSFGLSVTGGAEVRLSPHTALLGEVSYLAVEQGRVPLSSSALTARVGVKHYF